MLIFNNKTGGVKTATTTKENKMYTVTIKHYPNEYGKPEKFKSRLQVFHYLRKRVCAKFTDMENYMGWKKVVFNENDFSWYGFPINIMKDK